MKYTTSYVKAIAEFTLGLGNRTAVWEYVKNFNPSDPKYIEDEKRFIAKSETDKKLNEVNEKIRQDNYYMDVFLIPAYRKTVISMLISNKKGDEKSDKEFLKRIDGWLKYSFSNEKKEVDEKLSYAETANKFMNKYAINANIEGVVSSICGIAMFNERHSTYAEYYKVLFQAYYGQAQKKDVKIEEFHRDFEKMLSEIRHAETGVSGVKSMKDKSFDFGCLSGQKLKELLIETKKPECDYVSEAKQSIKNVKDEEVIDFYKKRIEDKMQDKSSEEDKLRFCMANVKAMQDYYSSKPSLYKITAFFKSRRESKIVVEMQKAMVEKFGAEKVAEFSGKDTIYSESFDKDCKSIEKYCDSVSKQQEKFAEEFIVDIASKQEGVETEQVELEPAPVIEDKNFTLNK